VVVAVVAIAVVGMMLAAAAPVAIEQLLCRLQQARGLLALPVAVALDQTVEIVVLLE
jgi:hypothetical protein